LINIEASTKPNNVSIFTFQTGSLHMTSTTKWREM